MGGERIFIGVMGVTGAGKSTFIKTVTGDETIEIGHELVSCTSAVCPYGFVHEGYKIILIDTPGFNDTFKSETEVLKEIASWLEKTYRNEDIRLSGIVYMHPLEDRRMGGSSLRNLKMFRQLCGDQPMENVVMTTSGWGLVKKSGQIERGVKREHELSSKKEFWEPMLRKGAKVARFEDSKESALKIIMSLVPKEPVILQIQHELVEEEKDLIDTAAGTTVNEELAVLQAKYEKQLQEIQDEMKAALKDRDEELQAALDEERTKIEHLREDARRAQDSLRYEQRNAARRHENEMQDLRLALEDSRQAAEAEKERRRQDRLEMEAARIAEHMRFEQVVARMEQNMSKLRREEQQAVQAEIDKAKKKQKSKGSGRTVALLLNVLGVAGSVTMSVLGLGFMNPFSSLIGDVFGGDSA